MGDQFPKVRAAVVQAAAVVMDREATTEKVVRLIGEAASGGARLVVFPEALIPAYPWGVRFGTRIGGRTLDGRRAWARYWANAVEVPGPATEAIGAAARRAQATVAIGVIERDSTFSRGTLYCTLLYFGPDGRLLAKHRKLMPTAGERYIWGSGDGSTLPVLETPFGRLGGLICWENYMPLARMSMYAKGVDLYVTPTADSRDSWQATIRHIACEGRCFVLSACQFVTRDMYPADFETRDELDDAPQVLSRGGSAIIAPLGDYLAGPLFGEEGILLADLDLSAVAQGKFDFDVAGHYARPDVFRLLVNEQPMPPVQTARWGHDAEAWVRA
ncbi:MAG: carbon-nitrogen hydrolase family protein [Armatimonadetes bacterium]|nr:carbon-nitrogen hydrolase family protein [Armatimonadota bacterium]